MKYLHHIWPHTRMAYRLYLYLYLHAASEAVSVSLCALAWLVFAHKNPFDMVSYFCMVTRPSYYPKTNSLSILISLQVSLIIDYGTENRGK